VFARPDSTGAGIGDADAGADVATNCARLDVTVVRTDSLSDTPHYAVWSYGRVLLYYLVWRVRERRESPAVGSYGIILPWGLVCIVSM